MEIDIKTLGLGLVVLWALYMVVTNSFPGLLSSIKSNLVQRANTTNSTPVLTDTVDVKKDFDIVRVLLDLRSNFSPNHPMHSQLTKTTTMYIEYKDELVAVQPDTERTNA